MPDSRTDRMAATDRQSADQLDQEATLNPEDLPEEDMVSLDTMAAAEGEDDELEGYDPSQRAEILEARQDLGGHPVIQNQLQEDTGDPDGRSLS